MDSYLDIMAAVCTWRFDLTDSDLREIGNFTRENIVSWLNRGFSGFKWEAGCLKNRFFEFHVYGIQDFHAVCGDIDIPWASEESKKSWEYMEWSKSLTPQERLKRGPLP